jgi:hypothetical protein
LLSTVYLGTNQRQKRFPLFEFVCTTLGEGYLQATFFQGAEICGNVGTVIGDGNCLIGKEEHFKMSISDIFMYKL